MNNSVQHKANRLIHEKSPYLLQHAYNPVDWYPWSDEAFEKARREDKPVFLSIGYSTCHWCHVMERESFEDSTVAELMNEVFVSIKVDREERPDIDNIYMTVCQMMTGHGGWPLSIVLAPDKKPFFAGTYFPKNSGYGRIGFIDLIKRIEEAWKSKRDEIDSSASNITEALIEYGGSSESQIELTPADLDQTFEFFSNRFDSVHGGFGNAPKFPSPHNLMFLLRYWKRTGDSKAIDIVTKTLLEMRKGGIFDHVGKGFHRYSTDKSWLLPHFEKMLYDQAMLAIAYIETYQATKDKLFAETSEDILEYVLRDMTNPEGGFYSAEDADSEGEEGKFYVWTADEIKTLLDKQDAELFIDAYNINEDGNFDDESTGAASGENIPHLTADFLSLSKKYNIPKDEFKNRLESIREVLFQEREKRVHPLKDDKILTDWNGLMIVALAKTGRVLDKSEYSLAAINSVNFIMDKLRNRDGSLLHRFRDGQSELNGFLDDYGFIIWGLLELYEATFEPGYLQLAVDLQDKQMELFWDKANYGFFLTPDNGEKLIVRTKEVYDGAIPSGNSVSFNNLIKLNKITAKPKYGEFADKLSKAFSRKVKNSLAGSTMFLSGLDFAFGPSMEVVIAGTQNTDKNDTLIKVINREFIPNKVVLFTTNDIKYETIYELAGYTRNYKTVDSTVTVYICRNYECSLPVTTEESLRELIK